MAKEKTTPQAMAINSQTAPHADTLSRRDLLWRSAAATSLAAVFPYSMAAAYDGAPADTQRNTSMAHIPVQQLSREAFLPFGSYGQMLNPNTLKFGEEPLEFYRDMVQFDLGTTSRASYSICRVLKREPMVDLLEQHSHSDEVMLPLDGDMVLQVGPATPPGEVPYDRLEAFYVPQGTIVGMNPGVWHYGPFAVNTDCVNILVVLPERTYANDCEVVTLKPEQQVRIDGI